MTFSFLGRLHGSGCRKQNLKKHEKLLAGPVLSACAPFCGQRQKDKPRTKVERKNGPKTEGKRDAEAMQKNTRKWSKIESFWQHNRPKTCPGRARGANLAPRASWEALGLTFGAILRRFGVILGAQIGAKTHQHLKAILEGPKGRQVRRGKAGDGLGPRPGEG